MTDYIKREDAKNAVMDTEPVYAMCKDGIAEVAYQKTVDVIEMIDAIPSADVAPVRHGHWIIKCVREYELSYGGTAYVPEYECSCCGFTTESYVRLDEPIMPEDADFPKYCEYCGAKMDGGGTDA